VEGELTGQGVIEESIGNVGRSRLQLAVTRQGRPALTGYKVLRHYKEERREYTLVEVRPQSARMHQIRVHLSWWGYPLVGDRLYGSRIQSLVTDRIFLHLSILAFAHPVTGEAMRWESSLPPDLRTITHYLNRPKRA
jgi:23S rRNA pseudouridine1911/1915/1917 synthase